MVFTHLASQSLALGGVRRLRKYGFNSRIQFRANFTSHFCQLDHACWAYRRIFIVSSRRRSLKNLMTG